MNWPDLCERLLSLLEAFGVDTSKERSEFAVLVAGCASHGCTLAGKNRR